MNNVLSISILTVASFVVEVRVVVVSVVTLVAAVAGQTFGAAVAPPGVRGARHRLCVAFARYVERALH